METDMKSNINGIESNQPATHRIANACLEGCRKVLAQIQSLKESILAEFQPSVGSDEHLLRLALNEAEALARQTAFPYLFFPTLALEKAQSVRNWHARQENLRSHREPSNWQGTAPFNSVTR